MAGLLSLAALWILWCIIHSLLISLPVIAWMKQRLGKRFAFYRLFYVITSIITLIPVVAYQYSLEQQIFFTWTGPWRLVQMFLFIYALILFAGGAAVYDLKYFMGISQALDYLAQKGSLDIHFETKGMLHYVRHPWYSGGIAFVWAFGSVTDVSLVSKGVLTVYLILGTILEEWKLVKEIGAPYRRYQSKVPMLIPRFRKNPATGKD